MNSILKSAIRKCAHFAGRSWCGYLRPQEILELIDLGIAFNWRSRMHEIAVERKREGVCNPLWFYFEPTDEFLEMKKNVRNINN